MADSLDIQEHRELLDRVTAYRQVCDQVRRSSTGTLVFGLVMMGLWYALFGRNDNYGIFSLVYLTLASLEIAVGLFNRFFPSAEGVLLDGLVLIAFGAASLTRCFVVWQAGFNPSIISLALGAYWIWTGGSHLQGYTRLRRIFNPRPTAEHLRMYSNLLRDIRQADPQTDPNALDLPTDPPLRGLLVGPIAMFVEPGSEQILLLEREDVAMVPRDLDPNSGKRMADLYLDGASLDPFVLDPDNWRNYSDWKRSGGETVPPLNMT